MKNSDFSINPEARKIALKFFKKYYKILWYLINYYINLWNFRSIISSIKLQLKVTPQWKKRDFSSGNHGNGGTWYHWSWVTGSRLVFDSIGPSIRHQVEWNQNFRDMQRCHDDGGCVCIFLNECHIECWQHWDDCCDSWTVHTTWIASFN